MIKVAVTDDAKQAKTPDFIVNLKTPLADKEIPAVGSELGLSSKKQPELDGTYDTYTQIPGTDTVAQSAQIVLRDAALVPVKAAPVHKPAPGHRPAAHYPRRLSSHTYPRRVSSGIRRMKHRFWESLLNHKWQPAAGCHSS